MSLLSLYLVAGVVSALVLDLQPEPENHLGICATAFAACIVLWPVVWLIVIVDTVIDQIWEGK